MGALEARRAVHLPSLRGPVADRCKVGPDYERPEAPDVKSYTREEKPDLPADQKPEVDAKIAFDWWDSPSARRRAERARRGGAGRNNLTIEAADRVLRQAKETTEAQNGYFWPTLTAGYTASRQQSPNGTFSPPLNSNASVYSLHTAQASISYFARRSSRRQPPRRGKPGRPSRNRSATSWPRRRSRWLLERRGRGPFRKPPSAPRWRRRKLHRVERETDRGAPRTGEARRRLRTRHRRAGIGARPDAHDLATAEQAARIDARPHRRAGRQNSPRSSTPSSSTLKNSFLPKSAPSFRCPRSSLEQRPDVLDAGGAGSRSPRRSWASPSPTGRPQFVISADVGGTSTAFDKMFATGNVFWALSGNVTQTIFDGGTLRHKQHAAEEAFEQAKAAV